MAAGATGNEGFPLAEWGPMAASLEGTMARSRMFSAAATEAPQRNAAGRETLMCHCRC